MGHRLRSVIGLALAIGCAAPAGARASDFAWRGLLDLMLAEQSPSFESNQLTRGDDPFGPYRLRLFAEGKANDHVQVLGQLVLFDHAVEGTKLYVDGAYVIYTPWLDRDLRLMAGKIPWAIGTWGPRTYSNKNPLVSAPLMYQYHSSLVWYVAPPNADMLLAAAGTGQTGVNYFGNPMGPGMPIVDDSYWDVGVTLAGSQRPFEYAIGGVAGAPSWGSTARDDNSGRSVLGRIGIAPIPSLRVGVSGSFGPYLLRRLNPTLPPGKTVNDYAQKLVMADLEFQLDRFELRGEAAHNTWETPTVGDLDVDAGYVELKVATLADAYVAGRYDVERFGKIEDSSGEEHPWDDDVTRVEIGAGYRLTRDVIAKLVWQHTRIENDEPGEADRDLSIVAAQLSIGF
jgi:hypothetical protein